MPIGGRVQLSTFSHPTKFQYSQTADTVPMMPAARTIAFLGRPMILDRPKPEVYKALSLVVQMFKPSTRMAM